MAVKSMKKAYEDMRDTIRLTVFDFWKHTGGELEEIHGDALLEFVRCYHEYQPDKAMFKTFLINRIRYRLTDKARVRLTRNKLLKRVELLDIYSSKEPKFDLSDFIDLLSEDGRVVVFLVFEMWGLSTSKPKEIRQGLRSYLRKAQWTHKRIKEAFLEVKGAIV